MVYFNFEISFDVCPS